MSTATLERTNLLGEKKTASPFITMAVGNRGDHASDDSIKKFLEGTDIAGLTEMMSEDQTRKELKRSPEYGTYQGKPQHPQSAANVIVWRSKTIRIHDRKCIPILDEKTRDGKHNMAKYLLGVQAEVKDTGDQFWFWLYHQLQTVGPKDRHAAALHATKQIEFITSVGSLPAYVCADWNAIWTHSVMKPFREGNDWRTDVTMRPELNTMENRDIDYFIYRNLSKQPNPHTMRVAKKWVENIDGSDHDGKKIKVVLL